MIQRSLWTSVGAVVLLGATVVGAFAEKRSALVIGAEQYHHVHKLDKAAGDARAMKAALEPLGFEVDLVLDPDRRAFNAAVSLFAQKLRPGDVALVHFSGHGVALDGENYLLPIDVPQPATTDKEMLKWEGIALTSLLERIRGSGARTQILIIDACRDNPYAGTHSRALGRGGGLVQIQPPRGPGGIFIMYSAGYNQTAADRLSDTDPESTSVYTRSLLRKLAVEGKTLTDIAREVREDVEALAATIGHAQRPAYYDELSGPAFYFVRPQSPPQLSAMPREFELTFWNSIQDSRNTLLYRDYLAKFGERATFAAIARERIKEIEPPPVSTTAPDKATSPAAGLHAPSLPAVVPSAKQAMSLPRMPSMVATFQPSFDCKLDRGTVEQLICADGGLSSRDRIMSELYYRHIESLPTDARAALRSEQRSWLLRRTTCGSIPANERTACITQMLDARIAELHQGTKGRMAGLQSVPSAKPSFDCSVEKGLAEQAICADPALSAKDATMDARYKRVRQRLSGHAREQLQSSQRAWLKSRNLCRDPHITACLGRAYDNRIAELEAQLTKP
jgi:uncharacterized protein